ncbi:MAG: DUF1990 domain-containing protein, partial [Hymenobacter sp.]|nr:DUF1990 domain-containing protein [Hymenobacter sp.]
MPEFRPLSEQQQARLAAYAQAGYNFDLSRTAGYTRASGWNVDDYATELPP